ncbi:hypothetical protein Tco_0952989 [Tanacetum coccineum]|uniref:Gag protein n=1 Tax=Tanacetum coccineum TaxID=301880 RepID=A0ABQ5E3Z3_9ASTR
MVTTKQVLFKLYQQNTGVGRPKCDILLNNICEVFNRQLLDARDAPIISALEYIREYLMKRIVIVQKLQMKCNGPLTPTVTKLFEVIKTAANQYTATWGKLSRKGKSVTCSTCNNKGHNKRACKGQGGSQQGAPGLQTDGASGSRPTVKRTKKSVNPIN